MEYVGIPQGEDLAHYGVQGMKWGVRHDKKSGGSGGGGKKKQTTAEHNQEMYNLIRNENRSYSRAASSTKRAHQAAQKGLAKATTAERAAHQEYKASKKNARAAKVVLKGLRKRRSEKLYAAIGEHGIRKQKKAEYKEAKANKKALKKAWLKARDDMYDAMDKAADAEAAYDKAQSDLKYSSAEYERARKLLKSSIKI